MIGGDAVISGLRAQGVTLATGVPCSFLTPLVDGVISHPVIRYAGATSEGEAVGIAVGHWLAGGTPVVMCQNSGLGNMVNPLASLAHPCAVPFLIICTWRGQPELCDEPQHELMGKTLHSLLDVLEIEWAPFGTHERELQHGLRCAFRSMEDRSRPFCLVVEKGAIAPGLLDEPAWERKPIGMRAELSRGHRHARMAALESILGVVGEETALIATTGKTSRELFTLADRPQHFYQVGAMGCASAIALGVALDCSRNVVVLDGDGAALMKLGNMATIGAHAPRNLVHVLLDNGVHDSTGGQRTVAGAICFPSVAIACGYRSAISCDAMEDLESALTTALTGRGPHLIHVHVAPGSAESLGRPTIHPSDVARRFRAFMTERAAPAIGAGAAAPW